jgi:U3 small nucleolar RNA-associated protein 15
MDFVKLKELPKQVTPISGDRDSKKLKAFRKRLEEPCGPVSDVNAMCFSPASESSQLAIACGSKVQVVDVGFSTAADAGNYSKHKNIVNCLAFRNDGKLLVAGDGDGSANIYDIAISKSIIRRLRGHTGAINCVSFCGNGTRVVTGGQDQHLKVWDVPTGQVMMNLEGHEDSIRAIVAVGENAVISTSADGKLIQWDIRGSGEKLSVVSHGSPVERLALFDSGALVFSIGGGQCRLWDVRSMQEVGEARQVKHTKPVTAAVVSSCGDFLVTSSYDMTVKITRISTWEVVASYSAPSAVTAMAWRGNDLVYGIETGSWILRQRRVRGEAELEKAPEEISAKTDDTRYYKTVDLNPKVPTVASRNSKESTVDFMLRKFEYRKLIDLILDAHPSASLAVAIIDELIQRGGLLASLRDRPVADLIRILEWCTRNILADVRCSIRLVAEVLETLIEGNQRAFAVPESGLVDAVRVLNGRVSQEMTLQLRASALNGLIESVIS